MPDAGPPASYEAAAAGYGGNSVKRPHSPSRDGSAAVSAAVAALTTGQQVQFWHEADAGKDQTALVLRHGAKKGVSARLLQSHGWLNGTVEQPFDPAALDPAREETWPLILPKSDNVFIDRRGKPVLAAGLPRRVLLVRAPSSKPPLLSVGFMRWGGVYSKWMDDQEANDGDWGKYGSPPSDEYMGHLVKLGLMAHPQLMADSQGHPTFELLHYFVTSSMDCWNMPELAPKLREIMRGTRKTLFWMLWPAEWEDTGDPDFACYIERQALFAAMRSCEALGIRTAFPHPADQLETITSKKWMATLSVHPGAFLPAATLVSKGAVMDNVARAAENALNALNHIRSFNPMPVSPGDPPAPSEVNKDGVKKGVVKLGWSWENRFVVTFNNPKQLQERLTEMMSQPGCTASQCLVQEWVDFDFEMRLYFLPPSDWPVKAPILPTMIQCNAWGPPDDTKGVGVSRASFSKLTEAACLERWEQDTAAWEMGKEKATKIGQLLLAWLLATEHQPVPMIRLDFMMRRTAPGHARAVFGEYCEMGACCLGWKEGPPTIWRAALDAQLR
ncbi:unnamed protein product [Polarella glacialis]|uniref:Uncharacterized protein n=2 Tax=Polarella glacialis TaxID=89957 RepID=A0A813M048_POLGL|nr:unnamed protein product [Polarella glacialis]CAE8737204.1 unnamed protein product [Polarella glacialis]